MISKAFQISDEDICIVLSSNATQVANTEGVSFTTMAEQIFSQWTDVEFARIEKAARDGGDELDDQARVADAEIRKILVEQGVLKH